MPSFNAAEPPVPSEIALAALIPQAEHLVLSQLRPHFICNVLNIIYYMIGREPETARNMLDDFSAYLRNNLDCLNSRVPVALEKEISHVHLYIRFEQLRFRERLQVEYDLADNDFALPPLTLQPLVENAVRHGVCPLDEGGCVRIESVKEDGCHVVRIRDNGVGFDPSQCARAPSLGTIRARVEEMCGGSLSIFSVPGKGTVAEIRVPEKKMSV